MDIRLENVLEYEQPTKYIVKSENYSDDFALPVLTAGKSFVLGFTDETDGICKASESPVIIFDDFTADCKYVDFDFKVKSSAIKILHKANAEDNLKYYFYAMQAIDYTPFSHKRVWISEYSKFKIKNRSIAEQNNIVKELDTVATAIDNAKQRLNALDELVKSRFIEMFGTLDLSIQGETWLPLSDVSTIFTGTTPSTKDIENWSGDIPWVTPAELSDDSFVVCDTERKITQKGMKSKSLSLMPKNTVLLSTRAPIGKVAITGIEMCCNQGFKNFYCNNTVLNPIYLYTLLRNNSEYLNSLGTGTTFKEISKKNASNIKVPVADISLQNEFADFVKLIDKSKFIVQKQIDDLQELLDSKMDEYFG